MAESIIELTNSIEKCCAKLFQKKNFSISTYLDGLREKYKPATDENNDFYAEKKEIEPQKKTISVLRNEKKENEPQIKKTVSLLRNEKDTRTCPIGHSLGDNGKYVKCIKCGTMTGRICYSCRNYEKIYEPNIFDETEEKYCFCDSCAYKNAEKVTEIFRLNKKKEEQIIKYYEENPHIAVDLLCGLNTKPALEFLLKEIVVSIWGVRVGYCLWFFDIDNFKKLNELKGHHGADKKLRQIGTILKGYTNKSGEFWREKGIAIERVFAFRPGGDEFCIVTKGRGATRDNGLKGNIKSQKKFYQLLKKEINGIGINISVGLLVYGAYFEYNKSCPCTVENWLKWADNALSEAKKVKGKNCLRICDGYGNNMDGKAKIVETFDEIFETFVF